MRKKTDQQLHQEHTTRFLCLVAAVVAWLAALGVLIRIWHMYLFTVHSPDRFNDYDPNNKIMYITDDVGGYIVSAFIAISLISVLIIAAKSLVGALTLIGERLWKASK